MNEDQKYYLIVILINIINEVVVIDHCRMMGLDALQIQRRKKNDFNFNDLV